MASSITTKFQEFCKSKTASKLAKTLSYTGMLIESATAIFGSPPFLGLITGACKMGEKMLTPPPSQISDLKNQSKVLQESLEQSNEVVQKAIENELSKVQQEMQDEMSKHASEIQEQIQSSFMEISDGLRNIEMEMTNVKELIQKTYYLMLDQRHKDGLEKLEAAYEVFLNGSHDLKGTFSDFDNYITELHTIAIQSLKPEKISQYLEETSRLKEEDEVKETFNYVIMVRSKYLLLVSAFYMFRDDSQRVELEFKMFNEDFEKIMDLHDRMVCKDFPYGDNEAMADVETQTSPELPDIAKMTIPNDMKLELFLNELDLHYLYPKLVHEHVDYEALMICREKNLREIGLKVGERIKLLNGIKEKKKQKSDDVPKKVPPSKLKLELDGTVKEVHASKAGIYNLGSSEVNGHPHWVKVEEKAKDQAIWISKDSWIVGTKDNLGTSTGGIIGPKSQTEFPHEKSEGWRFICSKEDPWKFAEEGEIVFKDLTHLCLKYI